MPHPRAFKQTVADASIHLQSRETRTLALYEDLRQPGESLSAYAAPVLLASPMSLRIAACLSVLILIALALLVGTFSYTRRESVKGRLLYPAGAAKVYTPQDGLVTKLLVNEGDYVAKGSPLLTVTADLHTQAKGETRASIERQLALRRASLQGDRNRLLAMGTQEQTALERRLQDLVRAREAIDREIASQSSQVAIAENIAQRFQELTAQGFASDLLSQEKMQALHAKRSELHKLGRDAANLDRERAGLQADLLNLPNKTRNQLSLLERDIADLESQSVDNESKRELVVLAPHSGRATALLAVEGQRAVKDMPLLSVIPSDATLVAGLYVPTRSVGFLRPGLKVLLRYEAYPYQKFGEYGGTVSEVALTSLTAEELGIPPTPEEPTAFYKVSVKLDKQTVGVYAKEVPLQDGMALNADILLDKRRLYEWILEPLFGLRGYL